MPIGIGGRTLGIGTGIGTGVPTAPGADEGA
jgi:hypothetical protein